MNDVGVVSDGMFSHLGSLSDYGLQPPSTTTPKPASDGWSFTSDKSISIEIGVEASAPGWQWIRNAKAGIKIGFGEQEGVVFSVGSSHTDGVENIEGLKQQLIDAAEAKKIPVGHAVIVEEQVADNGMIVTSAGHTGELEATTNFDVGPTGTQSLASFAADFAFHEQSSDVAHQSFEHGFTIGFRIVQLGYRGWWWWRHIVALGVRAGTPGEDELTLSRDDYFAPLPGADFS